MIYRDSFCQLSPDEQSKYIFKFCECCKLYDDCELISSYIAKRMQKNDITSPYRIIDVESIQVDHASADYDKSIKEIQVTAYLDDASLGENRAEHNLGNQNRSFENLPFYMIMSQAP